MLDCDSDGFHTSLVVHGFGLKINRIVLCVSFLSILTIQAEIVLLIFLKCGFL